MMNKTCAVFFRFRAGIFLLGICLAGWGTGVAGQEVSTEKTASADTAPATIAGPTFQAQVNQRLEPLKSLDLAALKKAKAECEKTAEELAAKAPELRGAARDAYEDARLNSAAAKEIQKQMTELDQKLDQTLRDLPEVKDKLAEIQRVEQALLVELQVRTALSGLIAAREKDEAAAAPE